MAENEIIYNPSSMEDLVSNLSHREEMIDHLCTLSEECKNEWSTAYSGQANSSLEELISKYDENLRKLRALYLTAIDYVNISNEQMQKDDELISNTVKKGG